ncbi:MAG: FtsW/RodA/SpoVE family cell cycle protein [Merdibacter sp.]
MLVLVLFGSVMIVDINVGQTSSNNMVVITTAVKQGLFMIAGYVAMLFAAKVFEFNWFYRLSKVIIIAMTVLLILPFFSIEQGGSNAWIYITIGSQVISLQPSEFVKPLMIVLIATYVYAAQIAGDAEERMEMLRVPIIGLVQRHHPGAALSAHWPCFDLQARYRLSLIRSCASCRSRRAAVRSALFGLHRMCPSTADRGKDGGSALPGISPLASSMLRNLTAPICTAEAISLACALRHHQLRHWLVWQLTRR